MSAELLFLPAPEWQGIGYYLSHWNTDAFSVGCLIVLILCLSAYFYGCVFRRFIRPLRSMDCTLLGLCTILGLFQIVIFFCIPGSISTGFAWIALLVILAGGPIACLATMTVPKPTLRHPASLAAGLLITAVLVKASMGLNTNNIYFDSITYLSEVVESSKAEIFAHMVYPGGYLLQRIDPLHDYTGYYYFWGVLLKGAEKILGFRELTTPIYIWGATVLYGMMLGMLGVSSACVLFRKKAWKGILFLLPFMAPFYTNYFNTTLAFFGNTIRTVLIGTAVLLVFLIQRSKSWQLFIPLTIVYFAGLNVSSSALFLIAIITAGLFFSLAFAKEKDWKRWAGFIGSLLPLFHMAFAILLNGKAGYIVMAGLALLTCGGLIALAWVLRGQYKIVDKVFLILLPVTFLVLVITAFLVRNGDYGYAYFFRTSSLDDMTVNMTSHVDNSELVRNVMFYLLLALLAVNIRVQTKFKFFLLVILVLFINPLVQPAISTYMTAGVYSRVFDLLNNPFTLCFLLYNLDHLVSHPAGGWVLLAIAALLFGKLGLDTMKSSYSKSLAVGTDENWNWEAKVMQDSYDLYEYVNDNLATQEYDIRGQKEDHRVSILSQDSGLKGYVSGVEMAFTTEDYRSALAGSSTNPLAERMISLMYPDRRYTEDDFGETGDYTKLGQLFLDSGADYVVINNTLALWDDRGWYTSPYESLVNKGMCEVIYENDSWALLRMNPDYEPAGKHPDRYWVHKIEE